MAKPSDLLAVLVDADNISAQRIEAVLAEVAQYGTASVKRVYGDWTKPNLRGWKNAASSHVLQPIQQFDNTNGKNATDSALIIDAMDLLHSGRYQGFCLVSSDGDFTRLASRIRESGVTVYGLGERTAPESFRNACDRFTYLDLIDRVEEEQTPKPAPKAAPKAAAKAPAKSTAAKPSAMPATPAKVTTAKLRTNGKLVLLLRSSAANASGEDGWAPLNALGSVIRRQQPDFDPRNWGYQKLSDLLRATGLYEVEEMPNTGLSARSKSAAPR